MIQCDELTKRFGDVTAVDHVSFSVKKQSIFGFLGPNGSGKTTVIRMLCGILEPTEGTGWIAGHDVRSETDQIKGTIGYMSQKFSLYDELTVNENLQFYARLYGLRGETLKQRRDELIALPGARFSTNQPSCEGPLSRPRRPPATISIDSTPLSRT